MTYSPEGVIFIAGLRHWIQVSVSGIAGIVVVRYYDSLYYRCIIVLRDFRADRQ